MSTYFTYDGRNESGPFTLDQLKSQKLTRNTPIRHDGTSNWMPAEKLSELKPLVAPKKIRRPKDIMPVVMDRVTEFKKRRPKTMYTAMLCFALLGGVSIYSLGKASPKKPEAAVSMQTPKATIVQAPTVDSTSVKTMVVSADEGSAKDDKAKSTRLHWSKLITASNSNYGIGFLGGIKDLSVVVTNHSDYVINTVVAKLTYIKSSGEVWKTKLVTLYGIPPHDSRSQAVPDVSRGKKVKVALCKVVSKTMKLSYTEGQRIKNYDDPYFTE